MSMQCFPSCEGPLPSTLRLFLLMMGKSDPFPLFPPRKSKSESPAYAHLPGMSVHHRLDVRWQAACDTTDLVNIQDRIGDRHRGWKKRWPRCEIENPVTTVTVIIMLWMMLRYRYRVVRFEGHAWNLYPYSICNDTVLVDWEIEAV